MDEDNATKPLPQPLPRRRGEAEGKRLVFLPSPLRGGGWGRGLGEGLGPGVKETPTMHHAMNRASWLAPLVLFGVLVLIPLASRLGG